jgi:hypothetical protein
MPEFEMDGWYATMDSGVWERRLDDRADVRFLYCPFCPVLYCEVSISFPLDFRHEVSYLNLENDMRCGGWWLIDVD